MLQCNSLFAESFHCLHVERIQLQRDCMMFLLLQAVELPVSSCKWHTKVLDAAAGSQTSGTTAISGICCRTHMKCTKMTACLRCSTRFTKLHTWHHCHIQAAHLLLWGLQHQLSDDAVELESEVFLWLDCLLLYSRQTSPMLGSAGQFGTMQKLVCDLWVAGSPTYLTLGVSFFSTSIGIVSFFGLLAGSMGHA